MVAVIQFIIQELYDSYQSDKIFAPRYEGQRGHPILLDRKFWSEMLNLPEDGVPRDVIKANKQHMTLIDTDNDGVIVDIDTPETYQRELKRAGS